MTYLIWVFKHNSNQNYNSQSVYCPLLFINVNWLFIPSFSSLISVLCITSIAILHCIMVTWRSINNERLMSIGSKSNHVILHHVKAIILHYVKAVMLHYAKASINCIMLKLSYCITWKLSYCNMIKLFHVPF